MKNVDSRNGADGAGALQRLLSLQEPNESDAAFARRLGIAPQVLSNYKNRHHGLSLKSALRVHEQADISMDWLLAGQGSPRTGDDAPAESRPFNAGGRYVYHRLLRSVLAMTEAVGRAGMIPDEDARAIRESIRSYLQKSEETSESAPVG